MALNSKFKPSFEEFEIYLYKTLSNEDFDNLTNTQNLKNSINITAFLEFLNFETRSQFIDSNQNKNLKYLKKYSNLPIVLVEAPYGWFEIISENKSIISIHGNHQVYLCLESESGSVEIKKKQNSTQEFLGKDVTIGLIDSGIDQSHPDLSNKIKKIYNVSGEANGDFNGHGTFLAGIIAGSRNENKDQNYGISPEVSLIDIKVFNREGKATVAEILEAIDLILSEIDEKTPDIIVFGCADWSFGDKSLIARYCEILNQNNIAIVTPTGNFGPDLGNISSIGGNPNVLTIGTINKESKVPFFSGRSKFIDLNLPGKDIRSAMSSKHVIGTQLEPKLKYVNLSGTSISAAIAGGLLALIKESNPSLSPFQLYKLLKTTSQDKRTPHIDIITNKKKEKKFSTFSFSSIFKIASLVSGGIFILFLVLFYIF
ncbi:S8 family serine peptidase [Promethearchaeum syntrophicum]|uniref:S8 family serine peptidase n=1 Tax=Promethearchaeum syntrophicum TaxID=2594042 RepID=A0A5B9D8A2_9ARCH|nr:S8 family serine peptidase [Candidatus Prometheoarchaeum syntrophicum]QEE15478.1 Tk-subtilisin precursor [Candidatus Prometheoarchaeum syntrophicum]